MFFRKKKHEGLSTGPGSEKYVLYVHISEEGWRSQVASTDGTVVEDLNQGSDPDHKLHGLERIEFVFKDFAQYYTKRRLKPIGLIHLLLDEPNVQILDGKQQGIKNLNPAMLREAGALQLGVEQATYGERAFGSTGRREGKDFGWDPDQTPADDRGRAIAFMEAPRLENFLGLLDATALKVSSVVPVIDCLLRRTESQSGEASGACYMGAHNTYIAMGYSAFGMAAARVLPYGLLTFVETLSEAQSAPLSETLKALGSKDFISSIEVRRDSSNEMTKSVYDRVLAPEFSRYFEEINRTISYFAEHRAAGHLALMEVFGGVGGLVGLQELSNSHIDTQLKFSGDSLLSLFSGDVQNGAINLLSGSEGSLVTVGKANYSYSENRFIETEELMRQRAEIEFSQTTKSAGGRVAKLKPRKQPRSETSRDGTSRRSDGASGKVEMQRQTTKRPRLFNFASRRKETARASEPLTRRELGTKERRQDRAGFMLVGLVAFAVLYLGWMQYDTVSTTHLRSVSAMATRISAADKTRRDLDRTSIMKVSDLPEADKVLWSEKFLSLAANMDKAMWLTDVYLSDEKRQVAANSVISKKLVLEGAVLPSTDGHVLTIARYIDRLLKDTQFFMSDFREITFEGAEIDASERDHVVRFTLEAWYDKNKRVERAKKSSSENPPTLSETEKAIEEKNKKLDELVTPKAPR